MSLLLTQLSVGGGGTTVLTADKGTFVLTGQAAAFRDILTALVRTYLLSGQTPGLKVLSRAITGSFSLSGLSVRFRVSQLPTFSTFVLAGQTTRFTSRLSIAPVSFVVVGVVARFQIQLRTALGAFTLLGRDVNWVQMVVLNAQVGTFTLEGQASVLRTRMVSGGRLYTVTGYPVMDVEGGIPPFHSIAFLNALGAP